MRHIAGAARHDLVTARLMGQESSAGVTEMHYLTDPPRLDNSIKVIMLLNFLLPEIARFDLYCPKNPQAEGPATASASDAGGSRGTCGGLWSSGVTVN